jgi:hypothetical protein
MACFDRESRCCSITRTALCEIGTIDGIHDQSSEKHASGGNQAGGQTARAANGSSFEILRTRGRSPHS